MNSKTCKTLDPKMYIVTFGTNTMTDFMDGTVIEITSEDNFDFVKGVDGSEDRINKNATGADVKITVKQTSLSNDALSAQFLIDKNTNQGKAPLTIKDLNGTTTFFSAQAYIKKWPDTSIGDSIQGRTWEFRAPQAKIFLGGNL